MKKEKKQNLLKKIDKLKDDCFSIEAQLDYYGICAGSLPEPTPETMTRNRLFRSRVAMGEAAAILEKIEVTEED